MGGISETGGGTRARGGGLVRVRDRDETQRERPVLGQQTDGRRNSGVLFLFFHLLREAGSEVISWGWRCAPPFLPIARLHPHTGV